MSGHTSSVETSPFSSDSEDTNDVTEINSATQPAAAPPINENAILLSEKDLARIAKFEAHRKAFESSYNVFPSNKMTTLTTHELFLAYRLSYDLFMNSVKTTKSIIDCSTGNGGFLTYEPLTKISLNSDLSHYSYSQPSQKIQECVHQYLVHRGILQKGAYLDYNNILTGNGSTELYELIITKLFLDDPYVAGKHAILIPTPSYGLFIEQVYTAHGQVITVPLQEDNGYKLAPEQLESAIEKANQQLFVEALPDVNSAYQKFLAQLEQIGIHPQLLPAYKGQEPNISRMELIENLKAIQQATITLLTTHPAYAEKINAFGDNDLLPLPPNIPSVISFFFCNIHNPTGVAYNQEEINALDVIRRKHDLSVIEDLAHHDIILDKSIKLGYFGACPQKPFKQATLLSLSKQFCAAALRVGVAYISNEISHKPMLITQKRKSFEADTVHELAFHRTVFTSPIQNKAIIKAFELKNPQLNEYLESNNKEYQYRVKFLLALIHGIDNIQASEEDYDRIKSFVQDYDDNNDTAIMEILQTGLPGLKTFPEPKGSFFIVLDFSAYKNHYIGQFPLIAGIDFHKALYSLCGIETIPGEGMQYTEKPIARLSVSLGDTSDNEAALYSMLTVAKRLKHFIKLITPKPLYINFNQQALTASYTAPSCATTADEDNADVTHELNDPELFNFLALQKVNSTNEEEYKLAAHTLKQKACALIHENPKNAARYLTALVMYAQYKMPPDFINSCQVYLAYAFSKLENNPAFAKTYQTLRKLYKQKKLILTVEEKKLCEEIAYKMLNKDSFDKVKFFAKLSYHLDNEPDLNKYKMLLLKCYTALGNVVKTERLINEITLTPEIADEFLLLIEKLKANHLHQTCLLSIEKILPFINQDSPQYMQVLLLKTECLLQLNRTNEANDLFDNIKSSNSTTHFNINDETLLDTIGRTFFTKGDLVRAENAFSILINQTPPSSPRFLSYFSCLLMILSRQNSPDKHQQLLQRLRATSDLQIAPSNLSNSLPIAESLLGIATKLVSAPEFIACYNLIRLTLPKRVYMGQIHLAEIAAQCLMQQHMYFYKKEQDIISALPDTCIGAINNFTLEHFKIIESTIRIFMQTRQFHAAQKLCLYLVENKLQGNLLPGSPQQTAYLSLMQIAAQEHNANRMSELLNKSKVAQVFLAFPAQSLLQIGDLFLQENLPALANELYLTVINNSKRPMAPIDYNVLAQAAQKLAACYTLLAVQQPKPTAIPAPAFYSVMPAAQFVAATPTPLAVPMTAQRTLLVPSIPAQVINAAPQALNQVLAVRHPSQATQLPFFNSAHAFPQAALQAPVNIASSNIHLFSATTQAMNRAASATSTTATSAAPPSQASSASNPFALPARTT